MIKNRVGYLTSNETAKLLGFSQAHVRRLIMNGIIKAEKLGHNWLIKPKDIANIKRRREPNGTRTKRTKENEGN